jgi:hypothetical protein
MQKLIKSESSLSILYQQAIFEDKAILDRLK